MDSKSGKATTNGNVHRRCKSWIQSFVKWTEKTDAPEIWRKWAAISTIAAVTERRVWTNIRTKILYPNLYVFCVGNPGAGKSLSINAARKYIETLKDFPIAPTSMTMAAMADVLAESKRVVHPQGEPDPVIYNTLAIWADELSAFMHKWDTEIISGLTTLYDCETYGQARRGSGFRLKLENPQINMLAGTTPAHLFEFIPAIAWGQGFMSRVIMVWDPKLGNQVLSIDPFSREAHPLSPDMVFDLANMASLYGQFGWFQEWRDAMVNWNAMGEQVDGVGAPKHPRLLHYSSRRFTFMIKLSMIASLDRHDTLMMDKEDFNTALRWLMEAEARMGDIFGGVGPSEDEAGIKELVHLVAEAGVMREITLLRKARPLIRYATNIRNVVKYMEEAQILFVVGNDQFGKIYSTTLTPPSSDPLEPQ